MRNAPQNPKQMEISHGRLDCIISGRRLERLDYVFRGSTNSLKLLRWEPNWFILVQVIKVENTLVLSALCVLVSGEQPQHTHQFSTVVSV